MVFFGVRLWASVCLALFLAFWLQLDNPFWAGTSAGIVCQPSLGASLRKASFRLIGTITGAVFVVVLIAIFPQSRAGFLLGLAVWCGVCGFAATVLRNFASYAGALAGYTAVIIAADAISNPNAAFLLALARGSEICLGIVCAGVVLVLTGRGTARAQAATTIATIAREAGLGMRATLQACRQEPGQPPDQTPRDSAQARQALVGRTSALSALLDETVGESPDLRVQSRTLQAAVDGLFGALSGWRMVATHLEAAAPAQAAIDAAPALAALPPGPAIVMTAETSPADTRDRCRLAARALLATHAATPAIELVTAGAAEALLGLSRALNGVALLIEPARAEDGGAGATLRTPDLLPALPNGLRAFAIILAVSLVWILTAWPAGPSALVFAAIVVLLLSPRGDTAISNAWGFLAGTLTTAALAAVAGFALLPGQEGFVRLALTLGVFLIPLGAISAGDWQKSFFVAAATNFTPLLAPANLQSYDTAAFYNSTLAIAVGVGLGVLCMALLPQLSPAGRAERLRRLTLRDLARLATRPRPGTQRAWEALLYARISVLPEDAPAMTRRELVAALYVGEAVLRLRQLAGRFGNGPALHQAMAALGAGNGNAAIAALAGADTEVRAATAPPEQILRARAAMLALREALGRHAAYFNLGGRRDALH